MANVRIVVNHAAVRKLLRSPAVKADLERRAKAIAAAAGDGFDVDSHIGKNRARADVATATPAAMRRVAADPAILLRALGAGRG
jgi:hypothetical protein